MTAVEDAVGLPAGPVRRWLQHALPVTPGEADDTWSAEVISGGLSNLTYRVRRGADRLIIRRPPLTTALPGAHDMAREYRVLNALEHTLVPVPSALAFCSDASVAGAPFYVMREAAGAVLRAPADTAALRVEQRAQLAEHLVDVLAELHAVDADAVGLGDFGRRGRYAARQLRTWSQQWQRSRTRELPDMERLITGLGDALPPDGDTTVVHGDYRLDNTVVVLEPTAHVVAVLDWELATLGDPVFDLATWLTYWHDTGDSERGRISVAAGLTNMPGFPTTSQLAQRYAATSGRDLSTLNYALAMAAMKLAAILEGVHFRQLTGTAVGHGYAEAGAAVPTLAARGLSLLATAKRPHDYADESAAAHPDVGHRVALQPAILNVPARSWTSACDGNGQVREPGSRTSPARSNFPPGRGACGSSSGRSPNPGARLRFADVDRHRFTAFATNAGRG